MPLPRTRASNNGSGTVDSTAHKQCRAQRPTARVTTRADPLAGLLLASAVAFSVLLQMGLLENWFEVTRVTFVAWILFAVTSKEVTTRAARYE